MSAAAASVDGVHYASIGGAVLFGSIVPVLPTGPILSAGAAVAVASESSWWLLVLIGAVAAGCGDLVTYQLGRRGPRRLREWLTRRTEHNSLTERMASGGHRLLVVSRLLPAARIPALGTAGLIGYPMRLLLPAVAAGALAWSLLYSLIGLAGGAIFEEHIWLAALVAVGLVLLVDTGARVALRLLRGRRSAPV